MRTVITEPGQRSNPYVRKIRLVAGDIARQDADAVVTVLPQNLDYRGEINAALLQGAGTRLDDFLREHMFNPRPGDLYAVPGFNLACKHIFFCVVPVWRDDFERHDRYLVNACRKALETARTMDLRTLAVPPLASGRNGYPKPRAARLIIQGLLDRLDSHIEEVRIVCRTEATLEIFRERLAAQGMPAVS